MKRLIFFTLFIPLLMSAQAPQRSYHAVRLTAPPVIDGYGDDAVWKEAEVSSDFLQRDPREGATPSQRTEFRIGYDDNNIYVFAMMYDSAPDSIVGRLARRDDVPESDLFWVGFDSYHDRQTSFVFIALPSGSTSDALEFNDGNDEDFSWDPVWESSVRLLSNGWSVEMRVPLSQLRFTTGNDVWGLNVFRRISRRQEEVNWNMMSKEANGFVSQYGVMTGMAGAAHPPLFEALPYLVGTADHLPRTADRERVQRLHPDAGVDIKYGVSPNFTLDATFNPDFAQVEADPAVLNLTTFETFYPEKRPFFIEGTQILRFVTFGGDFGPGLFYSRRIGKAIEAELPADGAVITDVPTNAAILGAAKLSGKTEGGTSLGVLTALTAEETFSYRDTLGVLRDRLAEPQTSYNLFRVKQDFWGNSNVGGIVTATAGDGRNPAYTAGADWDVKFDDRTYRVNGFVAHSRITTPAGEFRSGNAGKMNISRIAGDWLYSVGSDFTSRKYYINDIGYFRSPNDYGLSGNVTYRNFVPGEYFQSYSFDLDPHFRWNYDGLRIFRELRLNAEGVLVNYWAVEGSVQYSHGEQDPYEPRHLGVYRSPSSVFLRAEVETDSREPLIVNVEENYRTYTDGSTVANAEGSVLVRPTPAMEYEVTLGYATDRNFARFADVVDDPAAAPFPGAPVVVFGRRDVDNIDLTLRSSVLFTRTLSLQWYGQFFWAKGIYRDFTVLQTDGSLRPYAYTGSADFNTTSLISNVVFRWEYREGSTLFVVWSHGRDFRQEAGPYGGLGNNIDNTFRTAPSNTYVVKVNYWLSL